MRTAGVDRLLGALGLVAATLLAHIAGGGTAGPGALAALLAVAAAVTALQRRLPAGGALQHLALLALAQAAGHLVCAGDGSPARMLLAHAVATVAALALTEEGRRAWRRTVARLLPPGRARLPALTGQPHLPELGAAAASRQQGAAGVRGPPRVPAPA
ncbi:hypothetical protein [Motilibacter rhizosphaerae]|uniref:hypothetical protein n=1 Tax=Motilibacter rhizosphaerae TaxID=598652 RepID=UPI00102B3FC4|nr:hypothetical protein [Motilibacter rhizosphaerae]